MNQLELVGMSESAKKRAAFLRAYYHGDDPQRWIPSVKRATLKAPRDSVDREEYAEARARYRIGERLRPCRGCAKCRPGRRKMAPCLHRLLPTDGPCDGSGVQPTRRP